MIRGSDGFEYADEAALLLREPIKNTFNDSVRTYREIAERYRRDPEQLKFVSTGSAYWTEVKVRQYIEGFLSVCPKGYPGTGLSYSVAHATGLRAAGFRSPGIVGRRSPGKSWLNTP